MASVLTEPAWLAVARSLIGTREIKGPKHEPLILKMWKAIKRGGIQNDETPWCAAAVGYCLEAVGLLSSRYESARSYLTWGIPIASPIVGCVVVFERDGGGHVGFVVGCDDAGRLLVWGGNQGDAVNIRAFDRARAIAFRWPAPVPLPVYQPLPLLATATVSSNEA